ncbi:MAG: hypothetical protein GF331_18410 [Chitinivibrionales bacterium]|nr:hypothetical protein [Chitinivibrionales bacterium]
MSRLSRKITVPVRLIAVTIVLAATAHAGPYSWELPHAAVETSGALDWQPQPFVYHQGASVRYIDFADGDDSADGTSPATAWKHHPWDRNAEGLAAQAQGVHTYVFKRGVVYRGRLLPDESGAPDNPIRLTSDTAWGAGEAVLAGSEAVSGWRREAHPLMPDSQAVWAADVSFLPRRVYMLDGDSITRIPIARTPNWRISDPQDVKSEWPQWEATRIDPDDPSRFQCRPVGNFTRESSYYVGAVLWTEYEFIMATPYATRVLDHDSASGSVFFKGHWGERHLPANASRFFLEDMPQYLDTAGEHWFDRDGYGGTLYIRLPDDRDPASVTVEAARYGTIIDASTLNHIDIAGLTFRFNNAYYDLTARFFLGDVVNACIRLRGSGQDITVRNCRFEHVTKAIQIETADAGRVDSVRILDNEIIETDHGAINVENGDRQPGADPRAGTLGRIEIMRNRLYRVGRRPYPAECHGHAIIALYPEVAEIAGNMLDRIWGAGLFIFGGKRSGRSHAAPLSRILIHNNKVVDPLLNTNDWGGIETWQGGPFYVYNNISRNPGGYINDRRYRLGYAYYTDGGFKNYLFNNIAWGRSNAPDDDHANVSALNTVLALQNTLAHNTVVRFKHAMTRHAEQTGRNTFLANLYVDIADLALRATSFKLPHDSLFDPEYLSYSRNLFHGIRGELATYRPNDGAFADVQSFSEDLAAQGAMASDVGTETATMPLGDTANGDFGPLEQSDAVDGGARFFVPWSLYGMVGEWHFRRFTADPTHLVDEHWNMAPYYDTRDMYYRVPRWHLTGENIEAGDYVEGPLEDWCAGALVLNGVDQYARIADSVLHAGFTYDTVVVPGDEMITPDIDTTNFLVEAYVRIDSAAGPGVIVSKSTATIGYELAVDTAGAVALTLRHPNATIAVAAPGDLRDRAWHHVCAEVDRATNRCRIYIDGIQAIERDIGALPRSASLANAGDLLVGKGHDGRFLAGALEFLRIARGTLADARTSIQELYHWQFNGPFLRDFAGYSPSGARRDVGALEYAGLSLQPHGPRVGSSDRAPGPAAIVTSPWGISSAPSPDAIPDPVPARSPNGASRAPAEAAPKDNAMPLLVSVTSPLDEAAAHKLSDAHRRDVERAYPSGFIHHSMAWRPPRAAVAPVRWEASEEHAIHRAANVADRDLRTRWSPSARTSWLLGRFTGERVIDGVSLVWYALHDGRGSVTVLAEVSEGQWREVCREPMRGRATQRWTFEFGPVKATAVRVDFNRRNDATRLHVIECAVHASGQ